MPDALQHLKGVTEAVSGYAGGSKVKPSYEEVSTGATGHAELVEITFDPPPLVSYGKILQVYFSVALQPDRNPTGKGRYPLQYIVLRYSFTNELRKKSATAYIAQLDAAKVFSPGPDRD